MTKNIFIGVAWPYVNGDIHIGHLAGYLLPADICARFHRYLGNKVLMASGSDCYGTPITLEADKRGIPPEKIVDEYYPKHKELILETLKLSFDIFTKTTTENHKEVVQDFFLSFLKKGYIFRKKVAQYYDPDNERFLPDRYIEGTCPHCGYEEARSDQCDKCGRVLDEGELLEPRSKITGVTLTTKESEHYFFDLAKLQPFLENYVDGASKEWKNWVRSETVEWFKKGLKPRAFTRDLEWGVPLPIDKIPGDKRIEDIERKRIYVWWEAVIGYLSASKEWSKRKKDWEKFWFTGDAYHYYFMGKDNLVFHTLFWPGELHLYNEKLHLPDAPVINQYLNLEGEKFSKSRGVIVESDYIVKRYGLDPVRFYLTSIMPEHADANFSWEGFVAANNNVLIGNIGNFINRTLTLAEGVSLIESTLEPEVEKQVGERLTEAKEALSRAEYRRYVELLVSLSDFGNKYLSRTKPWALKDDKEKLGTVLTNSVFIVAALLLVMKPLLIETSERLSELLGVGFERWPEDEIDAIKEKLAQIKLKKPKPLFTKIEESAIDEERERAGLA